MPCHHRGLRPFLLQVEPNLDLLIGSTASLLLVLNERRGRNARREDGGSAAVSVYSVSGTRKMMKLNVSRRIKAAGVIKSI